MTKQPGFLRPAADGQRSQANRSGPHNTSATHKQAKLGARAAIARANTIPTTCEKLSAAEQLIDHVRIRNPRDHQQGHGQGVERQQRLHHRIDFAGVDQAMIVAMQRQ